MTTNLKWESPYQIKEQASITNTLTVKAEDFAAITRGYEVVLDEYDKLKDAVTHADITNYCKQ